MNLRTGCKVFMCVCAGGGGGGKTALNAWNNHEAATVSTEHEKQPGKNVNNQ